MNEPITLTAVRPDAADGALALRAYFADVVGSYHGRPATAAEIDAAMREEPSDALVPPLGVLLVARAADAVVGCGGLRLPGGGIGELTRVHVWPGHRRRGLGARLVAALEAQARARGVWLVRLDTRGDLTAARALYTRLGYREVEPFGASPYSDHWYAKRLGPPDGDGEPRSRCR